jgi:dipeptidyl-peptidase-3
MKPKYFSLLLLALFLYSCSPENGNENEAANAETTTSSEEDFQTMTEQFADVKILRYQIPSWDALSLDQKKLTYYLTQAGLAGRDMMYDQNYRHNLKIRRTLEKIYEDYPGEKTGEEWEAFETYLKRIWFSNGIHHHYSYDKFEPGFSREYLEGLLEATGLSMSEEVKEVIFNPEIDAKKVSKDPNKDLVLASAVNFYDPTISEEEVEAYYTERKKAKDPVRPIS